MMKRCPVSSVIDNYARNQKLGVVFETRVFSNQLRVCGFDFFNPKEDSATQPFLKGLYTYVGSAYFNPVIQLKTICL